MEHDDESSPLPGTAKKRADMSARFFAFAIDSFARVRP